MTAASSDNHYATSHSQRDVASEPNVEETRCQLEHCSFCDYRVCCEAALQVTDNWEAHQSLSPEFNLKATENPAYGLSVKNWPEIDEDQEKDDVLSLELSDDMSSCDSHSKYKSFHKPHSSIQVNPTSQHDCDERTESVDMNQLSIIKQNHIHANVENKSQRTDASIERLKTENSKIGDAKHIGMTWSVLKHRQASADIIENCDKTLSNVIEQRESDKMPLSNKPTFSEEGISNSKYRWNKEKPFPLSLMKPIAKIGDKKSDSQQAAVPKADLSRQKPVERHSREKFQNATLTEDRSKRVANEVPAMSNPLSEIQQIKTEESIQEWLARIGESGTSLQAEDSNKEKVLRGSAWDLRNEEIIRNQKTFETDNVRKGPGKLTEAPDTHHSTPTEKSVNFESYYPKMLPEENIDTASVLCNASKISPANIPMVVMQCSRLHSHIGSKPPFQQTSLPMGTLVTALYQESEWLYVQTPHGVEGFITASNCAPIGTINDPSSVSRRPWEPCDFPIQISKHKKEEFARQRGSYIQTKLPINGSKSEISYISTVKMKTNFYNDRYFSNTFKAKDSIKIAKTVTDILRSSPETKVSH